MQTPTFNRRRIVTGSGLLAAAGLGGLALGTRDARAQADVTVGDGLAIADAEFSPEDGSVFTPWLLIEGAYSYQVPTEPAKWECYLLVARDGETSTIAVDDGETTATSGAGTYRLRGPVTMARFYDQGDFTIPEDQDAIDVTLAAEVALVVRDAEENMLTQTRESDETTVTVNRDGQLQTAISGTGDVVMQDDETDPTPTPPGGE